MGIYFGAANTSLLRLLMEVDFLKEIDSGCIAVCVLQEIKTKKYTKCLQYHQRFSDSDRLYLNIPFFKEVSYLCN